MNKIHKTVIIEGDVKIGLNNEIIDYVLYDVMPKSNLIESIVAEFNSLHKLSGRKIY